MDLKSQLVQNLQKNPEQKARAIARNLSVDRLDINQILHANSDLFVQDPSDYTWTVQDRRRPAGQERIGPFGPAKDLLPAGAQLITISEDASCREAADRMLEHNYSSIPTVNEDGHIQGVVTLEAIIGHVFRDGFENLSPAVLSKEPIRNFQHTANFVGEDEFIDEKVDWLEIQHVIVGTAENPIGILTIADVWKKLNEFAEAFVLIGEIETELRNVISEAAGNEIGRWLAEFNTQSKSSRPTALSECNFGHYSALLSHGQHTPAIEHLMGVHITFNKELDAVNKIRNNVMHFKEHQVNPEDLGTLRRFRSRVRNTRDAYSAE